MKTLHLGLFDNPQANGSGMATWRYPSSKRHLFDELSYWLEIARLCEDAQFDFLFLADAWGWAELERAPAGHLLDRVARPAAPGSGGRGGGVDPEHAATRARHHGLDAARAAVRVGASPRQPGPPLGRTARMEHRDHRDGGHGRPGVRRADGGPRRALRDGRRLHGARLQAVGRRVGAGRARTGQGACGSPIRPRSTASTTTARTSGRTATGTRRTRRRGRPCCSRRDRRRRAGPSADATPKLRSWAAGAPPSRPSRRRRSAPKP